MDPDLSSVHLLHGPYVVLGDQRREVPEGGKRLLAFLAIRGAVTRRAAAAILWPAVDQRRAAGNLRSACWRLRGAGVEILDTQDGVLSLPPRTAVDIDTVSRHAGRISRGASTVTDAQLLPWLVDALDLLPGWYEEWVTCERERLRTVVLDAIDAVSCSLRRAHRCAEAIDTALVAVVADPLRPTSQGALIAAHLGEGNLVEARRAFGDYRALLQREFGIEPPEQLLRLVGASTPSGAHTTLGFVPQARQSQGRLVADRAAVPG